MRYTLTTDSGLILYFTVLACAELFLILYGGRIEKLEPMTG
jgi:hypothetical protein